ncbi:MAG: hypothetical protein ACOY94_24775 [Bacillota bacterium]
MTNRTRWIVGGVAALVISGALFAVPALAQERGYGMFGSMQSMMSSMHGAMSSMHGAMSGDMAAMHGAMAPLMDQMGPMHEQMMGEVAALFDMTAEELNAAMAEGKSLAQLAEEKNVAPGEIQSLMTRGMKAFVDQAVEAGTITREQANQMFQHHQQHSASCVSGDHNAMMNSMHGMMGGSN